MSPARKKARRAPPQRGKSRRGAAKTKRDSVAWIRALAAPYLQGYKAVRVRDNALNGFWFFAAAQQPVSGSAPHQAGLPPARGQSAGFFVGYIESAGMFTSLEAQGPDCAIFAWVHPVAGALHKRLVSVKGSLFRSTFEYSRWLTHRPPRFVFQESELPTMMRHQSVWEWPAAKRAHLSRNFFIETLAWLVRSGIVRKLREELM